MNINDPQSALSALVAALQRHLDVIVTSDADERRVALAEEKLIDAFESYDSALFEKYSIATPFGIFDDLEDEDELDYDEDDFELDDDLDDELDDDLDDDLDLEDELDDIDEDFDNFDELGS